MMRINLLLFLLVTYAAPLVGQDRYMVFFNDKADSPYRIDAPHEFLSAKALERRTKEGLVIDESDLPVSPNYVQAIRDLGVETFFTTKWMNGVIVQMDAQQRTQVEAQSFVRSVEYVGPGLWLSHDQELPRRQTAIVTTTDVNRPTDIQHAMIGLHSMHQQGFTGEGVLVAVFDDGFANYTQVPAFGDLINEGRILYAHDFTTNSTQVERAGTHGTRVLSVLAADDGNFRGALPDASYVLSITEAPGEYRVEEYNWLFAAEKADSAGVDIINSSLAYGAFDDPSMSYTPSDMDGETAIVSRAAQWAANKGILVVNSAGNAGASAWQTILAPADVPDVMAVGAVDRIGEKSFFSSIGPNAKGALKPEVAALGSSTAVVDWNSQYQFQNGTSFSAPLVAGLAGGLLNAVPTVKKNELFEAIIRSADQYENPTNQLGHGIPHFQGAYELLTLQESIAESEIKLYPNPTSDGLVQLLIGDGLKETLRQLRIINQSGQEVMKQELLNTNLITLDVGGLQPGVYLVRIESKNGIRTKKLLIQ